MRQSSLALNRKFGHNPGISIDGFLSGFWFETWGFVISDNDRVTCTAPGAQFLPVVTLFNDFVFILEPRANLIRLLNSNNFYAVRWPFFGFGTSRDFKTNTWSKPCTSWMPSAFNFKKRARTMLANFITSFQLPPIHFHWTNWYQLIFQHSQGSQKRRN